MKTATLAVLETEQELPKGWRWVRIADVCEINPSRPKIDRSDSENTTFVPMPSVDGESGVIANPLIRPYGEVRRGYTYFGENDVLFAKITPCMQNGKHAIARNLIGGFGFGTTEFHVLRPSPNVLPEWVHYYLRQPHYLKQAVDQFSGTAGQQRLPESFLSQTKIPLPSVTEQKRIVRIIQEQFLSVDRARTATETQLDAAKALPSAYLQKIFSSEEAMEWPKKLLAELCDVKGGKRLPAGCDFAKVITPFPYIRVVDFANGSVSMEGLKYLDKNTYDKISRYIIRCDDVYISIAGSIGIIGIIPEKLDGANLTENAARLIIKDKSVLSRNFLAQFLQTSIGQQAIKDRTNTVGQPKLALERIKTIAMKIPPIQEQEIISTNLRRILKESAELSTALEEQINTINSMPAAILRYAFSGEL